MHRTIDITVATKASDDLVADLKGIDGVVGLNRNRKASVVPPGDVVTVHVLNRAVDDVMRALAVSERYGPILVVTSENASITDPANQNDIDDDVDEAIWEELEAGLRHQGRISQNYVALMGLGGVIAAAGLLAIDEPALQVTAAVAAAVIAPGFEPAAKMPLGIVLRRGKVFTQGFISTLAGYGVLIVAAVATYVILSNLGSVPAVEELEASSAVKHILHPSWNDIIISACGALAGVVIQTAFRRSVIAGALIAMRMIDAAALIGIALAVGRLDLAGQGAERLAVDVSFIFVAGLLVFAFKQVFVHRRQPLH